MSRFDDSDLAYRMRLGWEAPVPAWMTRLQPDAVGIIRPHIPEGPGRFMRGPSRLVASVSSLEFSRSTAHSEVTASVLTGPTAGRIDMEVHRRVEKMREHILWALDPVTGSWVEHSGVTDDTFDLAWATKPSAQIGQLCGDRRPAGIPVTNGLVWEIVTHMLLSDHGHPAVGVGIANILAVGAWNEFIGCAWLRTSDMLGPTVIALPSEGIPVNSEAMRLNSGVLFPTLRIASLQARARAGISPGTPLAVK